MSKKNVSESSSSRSEEEPSSAKEDQPEMTKAERLRRLYELSENIVESALGKDKHTKRSLFRLRDKVLAEIKSLEAEREEARQRYFAQVRKEMDKRGFVPSQQQEE